MTMYDYPKCRRVQVALLVAVVVVTYAELHALAATPAERGIVNVDAVPVYGQPTSSAPPIISLKRGTAVAIDLTIAGPTGDWCHIRDERSSEALGFVPCVALDRGSKPAGPQVATSQQAAPTVRPDMPASPGPPTSTPPVASPPHVQNDGTVEPRATAQIAPAPPPITSSAPVQPTESETIFGGPPPLGERFTFSAYGGVQWFDYKEKFGPKFGSIKSDYQSFGPAWGVAANFRIAQQWRLNVDYLGSSIKEDTETYKNIPTVFGFSITQKDDLKVDFHVVDADVSYSVVKIPEFEWAFAAGWHYYHQGFERRNFRIELGNLIIPRGIQAVTEDVDGFGVKLGTTLDWKLSRGLIASTGVSGYYLYDVRVDNSLFGRINSEGWALRWKAGLDYLLTPNVTIGLGYQGHYITVDTASSAIATLPDNRTLAHTFLLRLGLRF